MNAAFPVLCTALLFLALHPAPAIAWGCKGHQVVALIAEKHLTPGARHLVDQLLSENPVDPQLKRYCGNPSGDLLADASTWPDDVRKERNNGPWHYINIPRGVARGPMDLYCGGEGCISKAIADQFAILNDKSAAPPKRAEALRYLVHFLGDLHMPLHASTNNDEGGNCVPVRYFRRRPYESQGGSFTPNLHALWDTAILERDSEGAEAPEYADRLADRFSSDFAKWQAAGIHVEDWVWESHDLAETIAYGALLPSVPRETPASVHSCSDANNIAERMLHLNLFAGETYQQAAAPLVEQRVAQAGLRLALLLNEAAAALEK